MKSLRNILLSSLFAAALWLASGPGLRAQISVGVAGAGPVVFDQLPSVAQWATRLAFGGSGDITSQAQMDAAAQTNGVGLYTNTLLNASGIPPSANNYAIYSADGRHVVTRVASGGYSSYVTILRNDSGHTASGLLLSCDIGTLSPTTEQLPGLSVYFSLAGTPGSWQFIPGLSGTNLALARSAEVTLGTWDPEAMLYLLWTDDNAITTDTAYTVDNFLVTPLVPGIAVHPQSLSVAPGGSATFTVEARGAGTLRYQWFKGATLMPFATNQSFTVMGATAADAAVYSVAVSNAYGGVVSSGAALTVACTTPVAIVGQPQGQTLSAGATIALSVSATGTQPLSYQWYRGGAAIPGATNQSLVKSNAPASDSGLYHAVVVNCLGAQASSAAVVSVADAPYPLVGLTNHFWRYDQSGVDRGTAWLAPGYDDSAWPEGRGILAQENLAALTPLTNTVLSLTAGATPLPTYYFRTRFVLTNETGLVTVMTSNCLDDGAVFYLNGQEAFRYNMPSGAIFYTYLALAANPLGEGVFIISNLPPNLLVPGTNVLAVELHQNSLTSSDVVFGSALMVRPLAPTLLQITNQPLDATVAESRPVSFSVGVDGVAGRYQWFKDGVAIPGATASTLSLASALGSDQGFYSVVVSNLINVVTSRVAALLVDVDVTPPVLRSADVMDATHVLLSFSEPVLATTATNSALYSITNTFGGVAVVHGAVLANGTNVLLTTSALAPGVNYILTAAGVQDISPQHNALPDSAVPVARTLTAVGMGSAWDYFEPFPPFTVADPGPGWNLPGFDLTEWGHEFAAFAYAQNPSFAAPVPVQTTLVVSPAYASYFRATFSAAVSPAGLSARLRHVVDAGAVFYLNGVEVHRFNMPAGPVGALTPALTPPANWSFSPWVDIPLSQIHAGENLFAVELHQSAPNALQKLFAAELILRAESLLVGPLRVLAGPVDKTVTELQPATFRVSTVAATSLQWQVNDVNVSGATNDTLTLLPSLAENGASVRCVCSGVGGPIVTASATLRVLPDLTRPVLLGAVMNSNGFIVLSFSKPLDAASAGNLANYTLTNNSGATVPLTGATLVDGTNVWLSLSGLPGAGPVVVVNGVFDQAAQPNVVAPGSAARVGADYFIPFDAAWRYLLISTNETVQAGFMVPGYDDSGWLGPGNGLFYVEDAALPAAKNTLLSFFDGTGVNRINTHYFRKAILLPLLATNMVLQLRHIADDGMVLHLNGQEIYRFNMPGGLVTAGTQAAANTGDATIVGPVFLSLTNFIVGTNVFAVDVHQQGAASADVVMGVELRVQISGGTLPPVSADPQARLAAVPVGEVLALVWGEPGFVLEQAGSVNGPWLPVGTVSPVFVPATNAAAFYRLRR